MAAKKALLPLPDVKPNGLGIDLHALQGFQSNNYYWMVIVPVRDLAEYFRPFFERKQDRTQPLSLAQRTLNIGRVNKITDYIMHGILPGKQYIIPSLTVTVTPPSGAEFIFDELSFEDEDLLITKGDELFKPVNGVLSLNPLTKFWLADGQHRAMALIQAYLKGESLIKNETVPMMLVPDMGGDLHRKIFLDLNQGAKPTKSIITLFDQSDAYAEIARQCLVNVPIFESRTALEDTTPKGDDLFSMVGLVDSAKLLAKALKTDDCSQDAIALWKVVSKHHPDWKAAINGDGSPKELRTNSVSFLALTLNALAIVAATKIAEGDTSFSWAKGLKRVNWADDNPDWEGMIKAMGRIVKNIGTAKKLAQYIITKIDG